MPSDQCRHKSAHHRCAICFSLYLAKAEEESSQTPSGTPSNHFSGSFRVHFNSKGVMCRVWLVFSLAEDGCRLNGEPLCLDLSLAPKLADGPLWCYNVVFTCPNYSKCSACCFNLALRHFLPCTEWILCLGRCLLSNYWKESVSRSLRLPVETEIACNQPQFSPANCSLAIWYCRQITPY